MRLDQPAGGPQGPFKHCRRRGDPCGRPGLQISSNPATTSQRRCFERCVARNRALDGRAGCWRDASRAPGLARASAWRRKPVFTDQALATHHDGDQNRRDSFRIERSDLDRSRTDVHEAILRLREFRPPNQTRLATAFFANVAVRATRIPKSHNCCRRQRRSGRWARARLDFARKLIRRQQQCQTASPVQSI
jgi:hypothetical protein